MGAAGGPLKKVEWIVAMHLLEGVAMLATGPWLMVAGAWTLDLWGIEAVRDPSPQRDVAGLAMALFGALVFLMGWVETRVGGRLPRAAVEAWLIADILFLAAFVPLIHIHGEWNLWSLPLTALWPILYAPVRLYWIIISS